MMRNSGSQICAHRNVAKDGRIVCDLIASGDSEVSTSLCHDCPARTIACEHLRFSLQKTASSPITVRYATGRVEILDDHPSHIAFLRAACAERVAPINSPRECAGCTLHSARVAAPALVTTPVSAAVAASESRTACGGKVIRFPGRVAVAS
jgi:hypothetical protein